jgi:glycosyltransferase involved in cell wall biosynthesis
MTPSPDYAFQISDVNREWLVETQKRLGRPLRIAHIGNIANNAYLNAKLLREMGIECDVICYDYYHVMGCPEWEEADFTGDIGDSFFPLWWNVDLKGYKRPDWFLQAPQRSCLRYLTAKHNKRMLAARYWEWRMSFGRRITCYIGSHHPIIVRLYRIVRRMRRYSYRGTLQRMQYRAFHYVRTIILPAYYRLPLPQVVLRDVVTVVRFLVVVTRILLRTMIGALLWPWHRLWLWHKPRNSEDAEGLRAYLRRLPALKQSLIQQFADYFPKRRDQLTLNDFAPYKSLSYLWQALRYYDIVQGYSTDPILPMLCAHPHFTAYEHGTLRDIPYLDKNVSRLSALAYRTAKSVFITNTDNIVAIDKLGLERARVYCIPHAFDHRKLWRHEEKCKANLTRPYQEFTFFNPSRQQYTLVNAEAKGNDRVIRAARILKDKGLAFKILFAEWGMDVERSKQLIAELGLEDCITWLPIMRKKQLLEMYMAVDVIIDQFIVPSMSGVSFDAMTLGKPVISYDDGHTNRLFFGAQAPLISAREISEIAAVMEDLILHPEKLGPIGEASREWVKKYHSSDRIVDIQLNAYREHFGEGIREATEQPPARLTA